MRKFVQSTGPRQLPTGRCWAAACLMAFVVQTLCGCDGYTKVQGTVVDSQGMPVVDAKVMLAEPSEVDNPLSRSETKTGSAGKFSIGKGHAPVKMELTLKVTKPGYAAVEERVQSNTNGSFGKIVLRPDE